MTGKLAGFAASALLAMTALTPASAAVLDDIKARGHVQCGVSTGVPGFSNPDDRGEWRGFDVDYCRAIAAAIFDDPAAVRFSPLTAKDRFTALQTGQIDVLARNSTWTSSRDTALGVSFVGVNFYDGQGFLVPRSLGVESAKMLDGATICTQTGTTAELNVADFFRANNLKYEIVVFANVADTLKAYESGRCEAFTNDASGLAALRLRLTRPDDHVVLPDLISKEPLGPSVRKGDQQWFDIARWVLFALVNAEELGITAANVEEQAKNSENPEVRRLLGVEGDPGQALGLAKDWVVRIVRHTGNYGEIFERNVGKHSPLGVSRGANALWTQGGLQYGIPVR